MFLPINSNSVFFFFASKNETLNNKIIEPRVPINLMKGENSKKKRICVGRTVSDCLSGIMDIKYNDILSIYLCNPDKDAIYFPTIIDVPDIYTTGEFWLTEPIKLKFVYKVQIINMYNNQFFYKKL